jgi:hypothetical protein
MQSQVQLFAPKDSQTWNGGRLDGDEAISCRFREGYGDEEANIV